MLKIKVKSSEVELELQDEFVFDSGGYTKHTLPDTVTAIKETVTACVTATKEILETKQKLGIS
jgi:hypothetical protein